MFKKSFLLLSAGVLLFSFSGCDKKYIDPVGDPPSPEGKILMPSPDPSVQGEYAVVEEKYDRGRSFGRGVVYRPQTDKKLSSPLIVILHGNGVGGYTNYSHIGKFLASQGFCVASVEWNSADYKNLSKVSELKDNFVAHINFLYDDDASPLKGMLTNDVVLIGHSRGGAAAVVFAEEIDKMKNVKSVIALAPSPADTDMPDKFALSGTQSFLTMYGSKDSDVVGNVYKETNVRKTGFKFYDEAGSEWGSTALEKDMIFVEGLNHASFLASNAGVLNFQTGDIDPIHQKAILSYINAYLQLHLNGKKGYEQYFKFQRRLPAVPQSLKISHQHADGTKLVLANFEGANGMKTYHNGDIDYPKQTLNFFVNAPMTLDYNNFHASRQAQIFWQVAANKPDPMIDFPFENLTDVSSYQYLSLRIGQSLTKDNWEHNMNEKDKVQDLYVKVTSVKGSKTTTAKVLLSQAAGAVPYPYNEKVTLSSMLIRLSEFTAHGVDLKNVKSVSLEFTVPGHEKGAVLIDNIEFYR